MNKVKLLVLVALLVTQLYALSITSVTLQNTPYNGVSTKLEGSVFGGTKLYIEGLGFSPTMNQNQIFVGGSECIL